MNGTEGMSALRVLMKNSLLSDKKTDRLIDLKFFLSNGKSLRLSKPTDTDPLWRKAGKLLREVFFNSPCSLLSQSFIFFLVGDDLQLALFHFLEYTTNQV